MSVMLRLGGFRFHIGAAAYNELQQQNEWRWVEQERIGTHGRLQCVGQANEQITLQGAVATLFNGVGVGQLDKLRALGNQKTPHLLVSGLGDVLGYWVIVSLDVSNTRFVQDGLPRTQTFTLVLKYYGYDLQNP